MAIKARTKEIDGFKYEVSQFPADEGVRLQVEWSKILGSPAAILATGASSVGGLLKANLDSEFIGRAMMNLMSALDPDKILQLIMRTLARTRFMHESGGLFSADSPGRALFNDHFAGNLARMYKVVYFVWEVNYGDFFGETGIGHLLKRALPEDQTPGENQSETDLTQKS